MAVYAFIERLRVRHSGPNVDELGITDGDILGAQYALNTLSGLDGEGYLESEQEAREYLQSIYPSLRRHYEWFRKTQRGQIKQYGRRARSRTEAYRWRGRSAVHVLTSGMDDYPRGSPHVGELHLDLISWMAFFSKTMRGIANYIGEKEDERSFKEIEDAILGNIEGR
jgi:mannosyl-oligosaccharide glucosidase